MWFITILAWSSETASKAFTKTITESFSAIASLSTFLTFVIVSISVRFSASLASLASLLYKQELILTTITYYQNSLSVGYVTIFLNFRMAYTRGLIVW
jgi:hypothetical protein